MFGTVEITFMSRMCHKNVISILSFMLKFIAFSSLLKKKFYFLYLNIYFLVIANIHLNIVVALVVKILTQAISNIDLKNIQRL